MKCPHKSIYFPLNLSIIASYVFVHSAIVIFLLTSSLEASQPRNLLVIRRLSKELTMIDAVQKLKKNTKQNKVKLAGTSWVIIRIKLKRVIVLVERNWPQPSGKTQKSREIIHKAVFLAECVELQVMFGQLIIITTTNVWVAIGANSRYSLSKFPRLRKVSAEFGRKIRRGAKYTRRVRLNEHATHVFSMLSYFLPK